MKIRRISAVAKKEFLHLLRDPRSLGLGIAIPMLLLFLFGYALTLDVDRVPLVIRDSSDTAASRELIARFTASRYFALKANVDNYAAIERAIDRKEALAALVIPDDFARNLGSGRLARVQIIVDGSDSNTATIALGYAQSVVRNYSRDVVLTMSGKSASMPNVGQIDLRPRIWFNEDLVSRNYIFPGLIAVIMMVISALLTSLTIAREWESGTMEQLIATPLLGSELFIGKLVPYVVIGLLDLIIAVVVGEFVFAVPLRGSLLLLFAISLLFLFGALSLGLLISILTKNQRLASQLAMVATMLPAFLLSGFIFPIDNMPAVIRGITHIVTARYFVIILRGIYLKNVGLGVLLPEIIFLLAFTGLIITLALKKFRKKIT